MESSPNLFAHTRHGLAQDVIIAYLLEWAKPRYSGKPHELGIDLLETMIRKVISSSGHLAIKDLKVSAQEEGVGLLVRLNGR